MDTFVGVLFVLICILLIVVVLLQKGRGGGLGATFGGIGSSAFGTRVGDVFTWVTIVLTALFLLTAIGVVFFFQSDQAMAPLPQFSPAGGVITEPTNVSIQVAGTPGAEIRYTTDNSAPDQNSALYENVPVRVEPGTTLKARTYAQHMKPSDVAGAHYASQAELEAAGTPATAPAAPTTAPAAQ